MKTIPAFVIGLVLLGSGSAGPAWAAEPMVILAAAPQSTAQSDANRKQELSPEEAEREASLRPDQQEANATADGLGGRAGRHLRYVRVDSITALGDTCK